MELLRQWLFDPTLSRFVAAIAALVLLQALVRLVQAALARRVSNADLLYRSRKGVAFLGYLAAALLLTLIFSDQLGGLTVAFGVAGAGVAFALQEVIASAAGWLAISFGGFYKVGDRVQVGGIMGDVIDIAVLRTTLMECGQWVKGDQYNGRIVRVANSFVFKEPVFNYSADFPFLWDEITVPIKYGSDHALARSLLLRVVEEEVGDYAPVARAAWSKMVNRYMIEDASLDPTITLLANDNWMEYTIRYVVDYKRRRGTKDRLFTQILTQIDRTAGRVALGSATIQLVEAPPLQVKITERAGASSA